MAKERVSMEIIKENSAHNRYEIELDGFLAYLEYCPADGCMDLLKLCVYRALRTGGAHLVLWTLP